MSLWGETAVTANPPFFLKKLLEMNSTSVEPSHTFYPAVGQQNSVSCHLWRTCQSRHRCTAWWRPWWSQRLDRWRSQRGRDLEKTTGKEHEQGLSVFNCHPVYINYCLLLTHAALFPHSKMMNTNIASIICQPFHPNPRDFKSQQTDWSSSHNATTAGKRYKNRLASKECMHACRNPHITQARASLYILSITFR